MAKRKAKSGGGAKPKWKTEWPRNDDLKAWFRCMIKKCNAISDDDKAASEAHLPIEHLAEMGHVEEALRHVNRFLRRQPKKNVLATVRMAELGAKICLDADDLPRMEKYLAIAEATEPYNTRKCDVGFSINSVRKFRAYNGILDPDDAVGETQRVLAKFYRAERQFQQAMAARRRKAARDAATEMEEAALESEDDWARQSYIQRAVEAYAALKDPKAVKRCIRKLDKEDRDEVLDASTLMKLGMKSQAIARVKKDIASDLEELGEMTDPNIHFPVMSICRSLQFLAEHGEKNAAKRWLRRALKEMPTWPVIERGWMTSGVYHSFAEAMAVVEGPEAAEQLLEKAVADGRAERRTDFRRGAVSAALSLKAEIGKMEEAIEDARKIRSSTQRRQELAKLLARAKRWKELREVLSEVKSPEEAADIAWLIKFELPGGEVR